MRSLLFVPGDSDRKIAKGLASAADALILDLEDAVAQDRTQAARALSAEVLSQKPAKLIFVRINAFDTPYAVEDLAAVIRHAPFGVMLPKCNGAADLQRLDLMLETLEVREGIAVGHTKVLPVATETATAVLNLTSGAKLPSRLYGMLWGAEDLAADIGALSNRDAAGNYTPLCQLARNLCLLAAASTGTVPVDAVYTNFRDTEGLRVEAQDAVRDGFTAKAAIHPDQVETINDVFTPSPEACAHARQIVAAFAAAPDSGAVALNGRMLDRPHLRSAHRVLARAGNPAA